MHNITRKEAGLIDRIVADYIYIKYKSWVDESYEEKNKDEVVKIKAEAHFIKQYLQINNIKGRTYYDFIEIDNMFDSGGMGYDEIVDNLESILENQTVVLNETFEDLSHTVEMIGEDLDDYPYGLEDMNHYIFNFYDDIKYEDITRSLIYNKLRGAFEEKKDQLLSNIGHINSIKNEILSYVL